MGRPKHVRVMAGALEGDIFIGPKAEVRTPVHCISLYISVCCCKGGGVAAGLWFFGIV